MMGKDKSGALVPVEEEPKAAREYPMMPQQPEPTGMAPGSTNGLSQLTISKDERHALTKAVNPETEVEVRPDGVVFMPVGCIRQRLDDAFGPGQWAIRQERDPFYDRETEECCYDGSLWVRGVFVSRAVGGCRWQPSNRQMNKTDAIEGAKSDCLRRCCKDIGIGRELWTPDWIRNFIAEWADPYQGSDYSGKPKIFWRKKGQPLGGKDLSSAAGIAGEFPLGFGPHSRVPDGPHAGTPISEVPEEMLEKIAASAKLVEWKLTAKAEIVRRIAEKVKAESPEEPDLPTAEEILAEGETE